MADLTIGKIPIAVGPQHVEDSPLYVDAADGNTKLSTGLLAAGLKGVVDGSEAAPGTIGEYAVTSNTAGIQLAKNVAQTVCTISLSAGDWEIWGSIDFQPPAGLSPNMIAAAVSVTSDALPTDADLMTGVGILCMFTTNALTTGQRQVLMTGRCRSNSAAPIDLYLVGQSDFSSASSTVAAKGYICARRVR